MNELRKQTRGGMFSKKLNKNIKKQDYATSKTKDIQIKKR